VANLREARDRWQGLGRVLDAARCELLIGESLRTEDPAAAAASLEAAGHTFAALGIHHLATRARELAAA
jgi:hypothetical protein